MEKRNLYIIVAVVLLAAVVLSFGNLTGESVKSCIDSDGGDDPYTPGTVSWGNSELNDYCEVTATGQKKFLKEKYCLIKATTNRYRCDGGCVEDENGIGYCLGEARIQT